MMQNVTIYFKYRYQNIGNTQGAFVNVGSVAFFINWVTNAKSEISTVHFSFVFLFDFRCENVGTVQYGIN